MVTFGAASVLGVTLSEVLVQYLTVFDRSDPQENPAGEEASPLKKEAKAAEPPKVTITKVFDFAGEEIRYATARKMMLDTILTGF